MSIIAAGTTTTTALSSTGNTDGTLQFQVNGTTASVTLNTLGAIGVGSSPSFGTAGQVLTSGGSTAAPTWTTATSSQWTTSGSNIYYTTGSVAIGYTTPSAKLDVGGFSTSNLTTVALAITDAPSTANAGLQIAFRNSATTYSYASVGYSNEAGGSAGALLFYTNSNIFTNTNTERARFNSTGALVFAGGTVGATGIGITFPATQSASTDANTLDDYEEGTWTPGFRDYVYDVNSSFTYTSRSGTYTKIGRVVTCYFTATIATVTAGNGQAFGLDGLPFNPSSSLPFIGTLATSGVDWPANTLTTAITYFSTSNAAIFTATGDNVSTIRCTSGGTAAGDVIEGSLVYYVA